MSPWAGVPLAALCDAELAEEARLRIGPSRVREVIRGQCNKGARVEFFAQAVG